MIKENTKQLMHNTVAHHLLTNAQPGPEQCYPQSQQTSLLAGQCLLACLLRAPVLEVCYVTRGIRERGRAWA